MDDIQWMRRALCAGNPHAEQWWFADDTTQHAHDVEAAKYMCSRCEVTAHCLDYALTHDERFGIWGGHTASERAKIRTRLQMPPAPPRETWHGTRPGAIYHYRKGEKPCSDCAWAAQNATRDRKPSE